MGLAIALILAMAIMLGIERDGLRDHARPDRTPEIVDVFYFTVVSLTTVGYGVKGRAIVEELSDHGHSLNSVVVIDPSEEATAECVKRGMIALRGDASSEALLKAPAVEKVAYVLVAPNRDDACVLICLTVRSLAPSVTVVASAREEENIKLIYGAGADLVVAPSVTGGGLVVAGVRQQAVPYFLEDMLAFGNTQAWRSELSRPLRRAATYAIFRTSPISRSSASHEGEIESASMSWPRSRYGPATWSSTSRGRRPSSYDSDFSTTSWATSIALLDGSPFGETSVIRASRLSSRT